MSHVAGMNHRLNSRNDILPDTKRSSFFRMTLSGFGFMPDSPRRRPRQLKPGTQALRRTGRPATDVELRRTFIDDAIEKRHDNGELTIDDNVYNKHLAPPPSGHDFCTRSKRRAYYDQDGKKVAEVHYYLNPDNSIGASGLLDPKEIVHEGVLYYYDRG
jgi:hypothetical protein